MTPGQYTIKNIKILGSGCSTCNRLEQATKEALSKLGIETPVEHVTDFIEIARYGVMSTPALVINDRVVSYGRVLKVDDVIKMIEKIKGERNVS